MGAINVPRKIIESGRVKEYAGLKDRENEVRSKIRNLHREKEDIIREIRRLSFLYDGRDGTVFYEYDPKDVMRKYDGWLISLTLKKLSSRLVETVGKIKELESINKQVQDELKEFMQDV